MTVSSRRSGANTRNRCGGLAVALGVGLAAATGHGVAWADTAGGDSAAGSVGHSDSATGTGDSAGPRKSAAAGHDAHRGGPTSAETGAEDAKTTPTHTDAADSAGDGTPTKARKSAVGQPSATVSKSTSGKDDATSPQQLPTTTDDATTSTIAPSSPTNAAPPEGTTAPDTSPSVTTKSSARSAPRPSSRVADAEPAQPVSSVHNTVPGATPIATHAALVAVAKPAVASTVSTTALTTTPSTPAPLSPIAAVLALPGRIVNTLLGLVGITTSAGTGPSPISPAPLADLFFAVFRRLENFAGLDAPPAAQPVLTSQTFTGSLTTPTPTVAQFLNAATAEYVLGGTPGGMTPFTVNGFQMTSTNELTGESAQAWVTPQNQIIIAYQGTTGGTNLLFNPLIAVAQVLTDLQGILTNTTPAAFPQALQFAQQVQAEAALQGYAPSDIFVTGHSLGGWEAEYVSQNTGLGGIGFESLGLPTTVPGNGANSLFVNTAAYGDPAAYLATDLPGLQPFESPYVAGGGVNPHYGPIVLLGDPSAATPLTNAASLWGTSILGDLVFSVDLLGNLFEYHLPGNQAYNLDVNPDPGVVPWLGVDNGPILTGYGDMTIPEFLDAASTAGILIEP